MMLKTFISQHLQAEILIVIYNSSFSIATQTEKAACQQIRLWLKPCHCDAVSGVKRHILEYLLASNDYFPIYSPTAH